MEGSVLMQNQWWKRPALQASEAVLLPALERRPSTCFSNRFAHVKAANDPFQPVTGEWESSQTTALSTYVRPRGSMAGRGVLRAAGVSASPYPHFSRPMFSCRSAIPRTARSRFR